MRSVSAALLALGLGLTPGCQAERAGPPRQVDRSEIQSQDASPEAATGHTLSAAGVEMTVPSSWTVVDESDPHFAMAWGPVDDPSHVSVCTIELRRQGPGPLPPGVEPSPSSSVGVTAYSHGPVHGRLRELPGPTPSASVLVHCRAHRSTGQLGAIEAAVRTVKAPGAPTELPPLIPSGEGIAELCVSSAARQTMVCARRADGAVYCGPSTGETLTAVQGIPAATQLSCERTRICSRDAEGQVSCWDGELSPEPLALAGPARDIAAGCVVDAGGRVLCRQRDDDGSTSDALAELLPLGEARYALTGVERVLDGSDEDHGCVLREADAQTQLWCWDRAQALGLELAEPGHPQRIEAAAKGGAPARDVAMIGGRVCVGAAGEWTCVDGKQVFELDGCERRACGCSLFGATRMSCDAEPHERIDSRVFGRISEVVAVAGACVARLDGTVVCRGPAAGRLEDDARATQAIAGGVPGVAHVLELRASD